MTVVLWDAKRMWRKWKFSPFQRISIFQNIFWASHSGAQYRTIMCRIRHLNKHICLYFLYILPISTVHRTLFHYQGTKIAVKNNNRFFPRKLSQLLWSFTAIIQLSIHQILLNFHPSRSNLQKCWSSSNSFSNFSIRWCWYQITPGRPAAIRKAQTNTFKASHLDSIPLMENPHTRLTNRT